MIGIIYCLWLPCSLLVVSTFGTKLNLVKVILDAIGCICLLFTERIRKPLLYLPFLIAEVLFLFSLHRFFTLLLYLSFQGITLAALSIVESMIILCVVFGECIDLVSVNDPKPGKNEDKFFLLNYIPNPLIYNLYLLT